jgi:site-specific recombinase XerD
MRGRRHLTVADLLPLSALRDGGQPAEGRRHMHVFRHSIAVHFMNEGVDSADVKDWLATGASPPPSP